MAYDWSVISGSLSSTGYEDIYSASYSYSQAKSLKVAYTALNSNALSAKSSTEASNVSSRLSSLQSSMQSSIMSEVDPYSAWKTDDGKSSTVTALAKEAGEALYSNWKANNGTTTTTSEADKTLQEAATGTGTVVDEQV